MPAAARLTDPIGHSPTMSWLLKGLLIGAAIAVAGVAIVGTGGLAAVAMVGAGAAMGAGLGEAMSTMSFAGKEVTGAIALTGSPNVYVNNLAAARAHADMVACSKHPGPIPIATGSGQVFINGMPAARVDDKTGCSAVITKGSGNVYIGGGTVQTDTINPEDLVPGWVHGALLVVGVGSAIILAGPVIAVGGLIGAYAGGYGGAWAGGKIFGEGSDGQKWSAIAGSFLGGYLGAKAAPGAWEFAQRVQVNVKPGTLGMNGGNVEFSLSPTASTQQGGNPPAANRLSRGEELRQKYSHLSEQERRALINSRLEDIAAARLSSLEQSIPGAHFQGKHGAQTTLVQQYNRAVHGIDPITGQPRYNRSGNLMTPNSTRFLSNRDQINAIERASRIYARTGEKMFAEEPIRFNAVAGEGYYGGTGAYDTAFSAQVWFNRNAEPITAFPILGSR
ncbi:PAAR domain-containing protein [Pseudoduganella armeniaca]|uniref:Rhs family protein n=1 Tax=Pseudoduganella armeniaca TaxID=2072590 RepID=A0A2R4CC69_9BURK|nr:Rhs family protein [Pseudoduganella armeniaca]